MERPTFDNLDQEQPAACNNVCRHVDNGNWEEALLTLNGDAATGLEYPDSRTRYEAAKAYFLAKVPKDTLAALVTDYDKPV